MINLLNILGVIGLASVTSLSGGLQPKRTFDVRDDGKYFTFQGALSELSSFSGSADGDMWISGWGFNIIHGTFGQYELPAISFTYNIDTDYDYFDAYLNDNILYSDLTYDALFMVSWEFQSSNLIRYISGTWAFSQQYLTSISYRNFAFTNQNIFKNYPKGTNNYPRRVAFYNFLPFGTNQSLVWDYSMYDIVQGNYGQIAYQGFSSPSTHDTSNFRYYPLSYGLRYGYTNYQDGTYINSTINYNDVKDVPLSFGLHFNYNLPNNYQDGYNDGYLDGENAGYQTGYEYGENVGYNNGRADGAQYGYQIGYNNGYQEGQEQDNTAFVIFTGIIDVALVPVNVFLGILNFEVFGINIGALVSSFLTISIVIILWRIISGGKND